MKKTTTLLLSLLALTHTSNIQAANEGGADVLVALTVAINDAAKKASENLSDQEITDLKNCANNNFSGDDCQDYLKTICDTIQQSNYYQQVKTSAYASVRLYGVQDCKDVFTTAQTKNKYVGLCNFEEDLCSTSKPKS